MSDYGREVPKEYEPLGGIDGGDPGQLDFDIVRTDGRLPGPAAPYEAPIVASDGRGYRPPDGASTAEREPGEPAPAAEPDRIEYASGADFDQVSADVAAGIVAEEAAEREGWRATVPVVPLSVREAVEDAAAESVNGHAEEVRIVYPPLQQQVGVVGDEVPAESVTDEVPEVPQNAVNPEQPEQAETIADPAAADALPGPEAQDAEVADPAADTSEQVEAEPVAAETDTAQDAQLEPEAKAEATAEPIDEAPEVLDGAEAPVDGLAEQSAYEVIEPDIIEREPTGPNLGDIVDAVIVEEEGPETGQELVPSDGAADENVEAEQLHADGTWATEDGKHEGMTRDEWEAEQAALAEEAKKFFEDLIAEHDAQAAEAAERLRERAERIRKENERYGNEEDILRHREMLDKLQKRLEEMDLNEDVGPEVPPEPQPAAEDPTFLQQPEAPLASEMQQPPVDTPEQPEPSESKSDVPPPPVGARGFPIGDLRNNPPYVPPGKGKKFLNAIGRGSGKSAMALAALAASSVGAVFGAFFQKMEVVGTPTPSSEGGYDVTVRRGGQTSRVNVKANSADDAKANLKWSLGNFGTRFRAALKAN